MKATILQKLQEIEEGKGIRILFACESGSRGWGFPSPDSDYDVRFIYTRDINDYLSVTDHADHMSFPINSELDISGWDLRKALQLSGKSNVTPYEWLQSPVIYREETAFRQELLDICRHYFSQRSNVHHYLGVAGGALANLELKEAIKIKKLFYIIRSLLAALWCLERNTIAPMHIGQLMQQLPPSLQTKLQELIRLKSGAAESDLITTETIWADWINDTIAHCSAAALRTAKTNGATSMLDHFFRKTIYGHDHTGA